LKYAGNKEIMASKGKIKECQILEQTIYEMKVKKNIIHIEVPNLQRHRMER
jgi:hypothetical protein